MKFWVNMEGNWSLMFLSGLLLFCGTEGLSTEEERILCLPQNNCKSCLQANLQCAWCTQWEYSNSTTNKLRCMTPKTLAALGCPAAAIKLAQAGSVTLSVDKEFQDVILEKSPVQLRPQKVKLQLRPHSTETVTLRYRPAKNYPLDLYYLMDLSWTMKDDKDTLVGLSTKLAGTLNNVTNQARVGFGSYGDKPLMPYVFPGLENDPCRKEHATCAPLYSFRNQMKLSDNITDFTNKVNNSDITGSMDNLESGLDGVVQAVVCGEQVGWSDQSRKLILVATDGLMHFAGDGKLGGVVHRSDFKCHLNDSGEYTMAKVFDYPSLAEVSRLLHDHKINLIFAVTEERYPEFKLIADLLQEKARVATLTEDSSNILQIVEQAYHDIVTKVVLRHNSIGSLKLRYFSNCGSEGAPEVETSQCDGIVEGHVYEFKAKFSLDECPQNESLWKRTVVIEDALASEASQTEIEVELLCDCECENQADNHCPNGEVECGLCICNPGMSDTAKCLKPGGEQLCSGRGECICGECACNSGYIGDHCECPLCKSGKDKKGSDLGVCSNRGTCTCGKCECNKGWEGDACECPIGVEDCTTPGTNEICTGHGTCECGICRCNVRAPDGLFYRGSYCESSAGRAGSALCSTFDRCVNATVKYAQDVEKYCNTNTTKYITQSVDDINNEHDHYCFIKNIQGTGECRIPYIYVFNDDNTLTLRIGKEACSTPQSAGFISGIVFTTVVLLGLMTLLIWKCWTVMKDKKEYARFEQERKRTVYALDENPLFKPATTRFRVPSMIKE